MPAVAKSRDGGEAPVAAHVRGREVGIAAGPDLGRGKTTARTRDLPRGHIGTNGRNRS